MNDDRLVIDASVALKWVVEEEGTAQALSLRHSAARLLAPDLLMVECANVLWKKVIRSELPADHARLAARLLQGSEVELLATRHLVERTLALATLLNHAAHDCLYLALAEEQDCRFVTADRRFAERTRASPDAASRRILTLSEVPS